MKPPCNQLAVNTVYHRPANTGAPAAPNRNKLFMLGRRNSVPPTTAMPPGSAISENVYMTMQAVNTRGVKPRSRPRRLSAGANPHKPGFHRPQLKHRSSLTPTRLPQDGQTTEPHFCRSIMFCVRPRSWAVDPYSNLIWYGTMRVLCFDISTGGLTRALFD